MRVCSIAVLVIWMGFLLAGCSQDAERQARLEKMSSKERFVLGVLEQRCVRCHTPPDPEGKVVLTEPKHLLPLVDSTQVYDDFALYNRIMGDSTIKAHDRAEFMPTSAEIDSLRQWLLAEHRERVLIDLVKKRLFPAGQ